MNTNLVLNRYINKIYNIPTSILKHEDYVNYFNEVYTELYDGKIKYWNNMLCNMYNIYVSYHNVDIEVFKETICDFDRSFTEYILEIIRWKESYKEFISDKCLVKNPLKYSSNCKNLYNNTQLDKEFISIDLKSANFQALKLYNPEILDNTANYSDFITFHYNNYFIEDNAFQDKEFIDMLLELFISNKQRRQYLFWNLNTKRQMAIENNMIVEIVHTLVDLKIINSVDSIELLNNDEVIINRENFDISNLEELSNIIFNKTWFEVNIEFFLLTSIKDFWRNSYVKEFYNKEWFKFKWVSKNYFLNALKTYSRNNLGNNTRFTDTSEYDKYFYDAESKQVATYL